MRLCKAYDFNGIKGYKLGWSIAGPPMMSTHFFVFHDIMVDTGQAHMQLEAVSIAAENGTKRIFLTHHHEDHTGNAAAIKNAQDAVVHGHPLTAKKMATHFNIFPYQKYVWGKSTPLQIDPFPEKIETPLGKMTPIHTPGHSKDHTSYLLNDRGVLFSGDLYLADRIKFFRADEDMGSQIQSLKKILEFDFNMLLCNHNPRIENGKKHIENKLMFLEDLYGSIIREWEKGYAEKQILKQLNLKEAYFVKYFCFGNVSMLNGIRSTIRHYKTL